MAVDKCKPLSLANLRTLASSNDVMTYVRNNGNGWYCEIQTSGELFALVTARSKDIRYFKHATSAMDILLQSGFNSINVRKTDIAVKSKKTKAKRKALAG